MPTHFAVRCHDNNFFEMGNVCFITFKKIFLQCSLSHSSVELRSAECLIIITNKNEQQQNNADTEYYVTVHYYY